MSSDTKHFLHLDETSWGLYPFPVMMAEVSRNPHRTPTGLGTFRFGRSTPSGVRVSGLNLRLTKDTRAVSGEEPVASWFRLGRAAAPVLLFQALPSFWLSRFRFVGSAHDLRTAVTPTLDYQSFIEKRKDQRNSLIRHADSLKQKAWALRYHRANLHSALSRALADSATWFESFRLERANTAHAFATLLRPGVGTTDLVLWQQPDSRIYASATPPTREAAAHVRNILGDFDSLVERLSEYMLRLFDTWDVVSFAHADPATPQIRKTTRAWARELSFSQEPQYNVHGWMVLDNEGTVQMATNAQGTMVTGAASHFA